MEIGDKIYLYGQHPVCHVRAFVDDEVVYRWYSRRKQYWRYDVDWYPTDPVLSWVLDKYAKAPVSKE